MTIISRGAAKVKQIAHLRQRWNHWLTLGRYRKGFGVTRWALAILLFAGGLSILNSDPTSGVARVIATQAGEPLLRFYGALTMFAGFLLGLISRPTLKQFAYCISPIGAYTLFTAQGLLLGLVVNVTGFLFFLLLCIVLGAVLYGYSEESDIERALALLRQFERRGIVEWRSDESR